MLALGDFLCIPTPNTGQLNPLFHTIAEFRLIVNRIVARQSTDWLAANAQFSPNGCLRLIENRILHGPSMHAIEFSLHYTKLSTLPTKAYMEKSLKNKFSQKIAPNGD